jgi:hypothetical protein
MRRLRFLGLLTACAIALGATQARAETLPFTGTLSLTFTFLPAPPVQGSGVATVGDSGGSHLISFGLPASAFSIAGAVAPVTDPAAAPIKGLQLSVHNDVGAFSGGPLGGIMPLSGLMRVCALRACSNTVSVANLSVPLSVVGVGGYVTVPPPSGTATVRVTVQGAPWTAGVAAVGTITKQGFEHGPASATSSAAQASGAVRLVTPIFIAADYPGFNYLPSFATLDIHFVPEPSTLLLLGGGIAGLVMLGRLKRD